MMIPGEDTTAGEPHPLTWKDDERIREPSDWPKPESRSDEDLRCPPALDPLVQEFLLGGDVPWAGDRMEDNPQQTSTPEPSPQNVYEWIGWPTQQVSIPAWWQELWEVPSQDDLWEFARRVWVSFQLPKAGCHAAKVENDYSALPAPHSLDRDCFMPIQDMWFGCQDFG